MSLPAVFESSKELMQNFRKAKISNEDVQAALNDLLDQKKEIEDLKGEIKGLRAQNRTHFMMTTLLLAVVILGLVVSLLR